MSIRSQRSSRPWTPAETRPPCSCRTTASSASLSAPRSMWLRWATTSSGSAEPLLVVAHLNHMLRGAESDADEAVVRQLHGGLVSAGVQGLELRCERIDMAAQASAARQNLEGTARRMRYRWLEE